jgi:hypothetical protein
VNQPNLDSIRKRILLLYFAGGVNLFMAIYVMSAGAGSVEPGKLTTIAVIFIAFAILNFYLARKLRTQWNRLTRGAPGAPKTNGAANEGDGRMRE